jgi:hypothetical protein
MKTSWFIPLIFTVTLILLAGCTAIPVNRGEAVPSPGPVQTLPPGKDVTIQINEKDTSYATITVIFSGGEGQVAVTNILVRVTHPDGTTQSGNLPPVKGEELVFQGTRGTDRIEAWVTLNTGTTYKIIDQLLPYRTRA